MTQSQFDAFWARLREVIAFFGGLAIMGFEAIHDKSDRPWLYAAAIGMMGLPIAKYAEAGLAKFTGSSDHAGSHENRKPESTSETQTDPIKKG